MKKWIVLFLVSGFANAASAAVDSASVCNQLNIYSADDRDVYRDVCRWAIEGAEYVEEGAINVCRKAQTSFDKVTCMVNALNKTYSASELKLCASKPNPSGKAKCMKVHGEAIFTNLSDELKQRLKRVKRKIKAEEYQSALRLLNEILDEL